MVALIRSIISIGIALSLQMGQMTATEVSPRQVAEDCMQGIVTMQEETMDRYAGNRYVNFLANLEGDEETVRRMQDAILRNLSYEIEAVEEREDAAVAKIIISQCDFSGVLDKYDKKAYQYITDHLYDEDITDKDKLNAKCLDLYVAQIEKTAKAGKTEDHTIYLPLFSNGYNGWSAQLDEETMRVIIGDLAIPEIE